MKRIHIVGRKGHGKTTLVVDLVREFTRRGVRVGTIKHTSHVHELDTPGKDSYRHRDAGADPAAVMTPDSCGIFVSRPADSDGYAQLAGAFASCDLVLVEGHLDAHGRKVEVWRRAAGGHCYACDRGDIAAVVTDDPLNADVPVWPRRDIAALAERILALVAESDC
jgi:molybdopterin-guanine dinucleotide biosynthesis protein B